MTELKQELLDQELIVEKARQAAIKESEDDKGGCDEKMQTWSRAHAKLEMIQKAIQVATDDTTFYDQVSDLASSGKLMQAAKVVSDHKLKRKQTECEKEFQKKVRRAELSLKREGDADAALLMARQLGASSALMQSPAMHIASQHGFSMGSITSSQPNQFYPPLPPGPPPSGPPPGHGQFRNNTGQGAGGGTPPGGQSGGGPRSAGVQQRTRFKMAEDHLGQAKASQLNLTGQMIPIGMKFYTTGKSLVDPKRDRKTPFTYPCKVCAKVGHEAFECTESFQFEGKPAKNYRELHALKVVDKHGEYGQ